jgi:putative DNA primase/helicase
MLLLPEHQRRERFTAYANGLQERFRGGILAELQPLNQWVVWRGEIEDGKSKKVPYNPRYHLAKASIKIPKSWGSLPEALSALETGNYSGIGFMLTPPLVMIDLDHSYDRATRTITKPLAQEIMKAVPTYYEASPYTGVHGLVYVEKPIKSLHTDTVEIYGYDRFTTITTDHIAGTPTTIELRTAAMEALYEQFAPPVHETNIQNTSGGGWERAAR